MIVKRRAVCSGESVSFPKELIIVLNESQGRELDLTCVIHDRKEISSLGNDSFGINFRFRRDEELQLLRLLQDKHKERLKNQETF